MKALAIFFSGVLFSFYCQGKDAGAEYSEEKKLSYKLNHEALARGEFQYFYRLLSPQEIEASSNKLEYEIIDSDTGKVTPKETLETFMPLDLQHLWDPSEGHHMAVTKLSYILPIDIKKINEERFICKKYLQMTIPDYEVIDNGDYFQVNGSFITPEFRLHLRRLSAQDPLLKDLRNIDMEKVRSEKIKVFFQYQDRFGKVFMFETAKMASAATIYEEFGLGQVLVTQYILSNIINVPAKNLVQQEMVRNMKNLVTGSRKAVLEVQ